MSARRFLTVLAMMTLAACGGEEWIELPSGSRYSGEIRDGVPHGQGISIDSYGSRYEGEWRDGTQHGPGLFSNQYGEHFEGEFPDGLKHQWDLACRPLEMDVRGLVCGWILSTPRGDRVGRRIEL